MEHFTPNHRPLPQLIPQPDPPDHGPDRLHADPRVHGASVPGESIVLGPVGGEVLMGDGDLKREAS